MKKKPITEIKRLARSLYVVARPAFRKTSGHAMVTWNNASAPTKAGMFAIAEHLIKKRLQKRGINLSTRRGAKIYAVADFQ